LSYRVLIVEDTDIGAGGDARVVLRERNFRFALLNRSDLQRADLTWANLRAARLWKTLAKGKLTEARLQGAYLKEAQLQGAQLDSAWLQGADLSKAQLQGAELSYAKLQGADLRGAQLQGANLSGTELQGADLRGAQLQGANLEGAKFEGADLGSAGIWLATFPGDPSDRSPAPLGVAGLDMSPLSPEAKVQLRQDLTADIGDATVLSVVLTRLNDILRDVPPDWDGNSWTNYASTAKEPSAAELARIHAKLACEDPGGSIASRMAARAIEPPTEPSRKAYANAFAAALLDETCEGGKALTAEMRAALKTLVSAPE
jgi:uncharacterized protein YjbI with pentapeptide repeats